MDLGLRLPEFPSPQHALPTASIRLPDVGAKNTKVSRTDEKETVSGRNTVTTLHAQIPGKPRTLTITEVKASVQVNYPAVGDLNVYMYSPLGTRAKLLERNCGSLNQIESGQAAVVNSDAKENGEAAPAAQGDCL